MDAFTGILKASPDKRYRNFLSTVADREAVWVLKNESGYVTYDHSGVSYLMIWPTQEYAKLFSDGDMPDVIEVHDFCQRCNEVMDQAEIGFLVFYNGQDGCLVETAVLLTDLLEELEKIE